MWIAPHFIQGSSALAGEKRREVREIALKALHASGKSAPPDAGTDKED